MTPLRDDEMLAGLRRKDQTALAALIDAYVAPVHALCVRILAGAGSPQDAEECASDTFHAAWRQAGRYDESRAPMRTWLLMLAKYAALARRRQIMRWPATEEGTKMVEATPDLAQSPDERLARGEERERLQTALRSLPDLDREVVYRRCFLGETTKTVAAGLGLTPQAVDNRLWRARQRLRITLRETDAGQKEVERE